MPTSYFFAKDIILLKIRRKKDVHKKCKKYTRKIICCLTLILFV